MNAYNTVRFLSVYILCVGVKFGRRKKSKKEAIVPLCVCVCDRKQDIESQRLCDSWTVHSCETGVFVHLLAYVDMHTLTQICGEEHLTV